MFQRAILIPRIVGRVRFQFQAHSIAARYWPIAVLLLWSAFLFFFGLGTGTLYRTEALRAIIGAECLNGHWLVPTLYGEAFLTKPPGMYAAIGLCSLPAGHVTEITARLPSAIAATITVLCFFGTLRRVVSTREAFCAAMLLPVSVLWLDKAPSAEIDMVQLAWVSAALLAFYRALEADENRTPGRWRWWLIAMLAMTAGFLTKWTAPAFFYFAVIPVALWRGRLSILWSWPHLAGLLLAALIIAGWACAVAAETGWSVLVDTVMREAAQRFAPAHAGKPYPWLDSLLFPATFLAANLPWSALALWALRPAFFRLWDDRGRMLLTFFHCWTWPSLLFWSLAAQHNLRYTLPLCPGLAGLGAMVCIAWARGTLHWPISRIRPLVAFAGIIIIWAVVKVIFVEVIVPPRTAGRHVRETANALSDLVPEGEILYLCKLKDEGILFYYGRPARKLAAAPPEKEWYVALTEAEWHDMAGQVQVLKWFRDQQDAPFVLARRLRQ
jgi:4-amino-4-deoxy-L-arabinose transferase-like glycosyltransferase